MLPPLVRGAVLAGPLAFGGLTELDLGLQGLAAGLGAPVASARAWRR